MLLKEKIASIEKKAKSEPVLIFFKKIKYKIK